MLLSSPCTQHSTRNTALGRIQVKMKMGSTISAVLQLPSVAMQSLCRGSCASCSRTTPASRPLRSDQLWGLLLFILVNTTSSSSGKKKSGHGEGPFPQKPLASLSIYSMFGGTQASSDRTVRCKRSAERPGLNSALGKLESLIRVTCAKKLNRSTQVSRIILVRILTFYFCSYPTQR